MKTYSVYKKGKVIKGEVRLPASKSISNRLLVIKALAQKNFKINNLSEADDTQLLEQLMCKIQQHSIRQSILRLDTKNAGTVLRFLTAYLSIKHGNWLLTGSDEMKKRPIKDLVNALSYIGAQIKYCEKSGYPPIQIHGKQLTGRELIIDAGISSQYITALLLIAPYLENGLSIILKGEITSEPYIKMTIKILEYFGIEVRNETKNITVLNHPYNEKDFDIEPDWSAASYWFEMAALSEETDLFLPGLKKDSLQGDSVIVDIYQSLGVYTQFLPEGVHLTNRGKVVKNLNFDFINCQDIAQSVICSCAALGVEGNFTGLQNLRIKETDRVVALFNELTKIGYDIEIKANSNIRLKRTTNETIIMQHINTYRDHRMAMSFAPLALKFGKISVLDPKVVEKSYPRFWNDLVSVGFEIMDV